VAVEDEQQLGTRRYRVYQIIGLVLGVAFIGLGVAAYFGGGGPIVAAIAAIGGLLVLVVSLINMVRS
jgi:uncharacterized membrane protein YjjP (DUF1212 family)